MKISEIQNMEQQNINCCYLIKEGIFWRAYELSAMLFSVHIKNFKLIKRYVKCAGQDIVYLGFPDGALEEILNEAKGKGYNAEFAIGRQNNDIIMLSGFVPKGSLREKPLDFEQWKSEIPVVAMNKKTDNQFELIIEKIKNYPVANRTPVESLEFLSNIQKEINEYQLKLYT